MEDQEQDLKDLFAGTQAQFIGPVAQDEEEAEAQQEEEKKEDSKVGVQTSANVVTFRDPISDVVGGSPDGGSKGGSKKRRGGGSAAAGKAPKPKRIRKPRPYKP